MKKTGFTLAELLVTLGIIGVIAALIIPAINHLKPNKNKVLCLKAYDTLTETIKSLASNSKLYPICGGINANDNIKCTEYPLFNLKEPMEARFQGIQNSMYQGDRKLCDLLAFAMGISEANNSCSTEPYTFVSNTFNNYFDNHISFSSNNGMQWMIVPAIASSVAEGKGTFETDVYVDVNGSAEPNCIYSEDCKKPDRFKFIVYANGHVESADSFANRYIKTRNNLSDASPNISDGNVINGRLQLRSFNYSLCNNGAPNEPIIPDNNPPADDPIVYITYTYSAYANQYILSKNKNSNCTIDDYEYKSEGSELTGDEYKEKMSSLETDLKSCKQRVTVPTGNNTHITVNIVNGPTNSPVTIINKNTNKTLLSISSGQYDYEAYETQPDDLTVSSTDQVIFNNQKN